MQDLITLMVFGGLGIGVFTIGTSLILLIIGMCIADKLRQREMLKLAGKFFLAGIMLFAIGFGSCVLVLSG